MKSNNPLRVLVVDDTVIYRKIVSDIIAELPNVVVAGIAHNGKIAISKIATLKPDLLTLDIEMPEMNGLEVLAHIKDNGLDVGAVMLSTLTAQGGEMTMKALELGAFDFIPKPGTGSMQENKEAIAKTLAGIIHAFGNRRRMGRISKAKPKLPGGVPATTKGAVATSAVQRLAAAAGQKRRKAEIVAIGISTGGPNALAKMMPGLPSNLGVPIVIVQHMPPVFTQSLANTLNSKCSLTVREATDGEPIRPNTALIAPGGKQMKIVAGADGKTRIIRITNDPPENSCKPSVDYLFRSVAHHYMGRSTGVIMTGMGADGTLGLKLMKRNGATVIAQDEATSVVYGMPKEPVAAGIVDVVAPLDRIAAEIVKTVR